MYIKCIKNNNYKNPSFIFLFYSSLTAKLEALWQKKKPFIPIRKFAGETIFSFHSLNKTNDFVTTQYSNAIYYLFI